MILAFSSMVVLLAKYTTGALSNSPNEESIADTDRRDLVDSRLLATGDGVITSSTGSPGSGVDARVSSFLLLPFLWLRDGRWSWLGMVCDGSGVDNDGIFHLDLLALVAAESDAALFRLLFLSYPFLAS